MNLAQAVDPDTGRCRADAWRGAAAPMKPPPPAHLSNEHYSRCEAKVLGVLEHAARSMSILEIARLTGLSRCTVYDCVCKIGKVACTGVTGRIHLYGIRP